VVRPIASSENNELRRTDLRIAPLEAPISPLVVLGCRGRDVVSHHRGIGSETEVLSNGRNFGNDNDGPASDNDDQGADDNYRSTPGNNHFDVGTPDDNRSANDYVDESSATSDDFAACTFARGVSASASKLLPPDQRRELL